MRLATTLVVAFAMATSAAAQNPYLPLWEYIPDGEPYVFEDPDQPGKSRVYIYGSHDTRIDDYCGRELVVWSASTDSLTSWRYDGVILDVRKDAKGKWLHADKKGDVLFAPDVMEYTDPNGERWYYLFPNDQEGGRKSLIARSKRPDGPFEVCNWDTKKSNETIGCLGFDPAVFQDTDGRVYGYWGFEESYMAELDPATLCTPKPGTEIKHNVVSGFKSEGIYRFFEASSMRKIKDKYVLIYSRITGDGEFGLPPTNYTLAYAYGNSPLGPFTYGGTIIDGRGRDTDEWGRPTVTATLNGNTHGSLCEINGQWWVFYHRQCGPDEFSRQAMADPVEIEVTEGPDGKVVIREAEMTSQGFATEGLNPFRRYSAGIACYYTATKPAEHSWPKKIFRGSHPAPVRLDKMPDGNPYALTVSHNPVVHNTHGSVIGYKYYNFDKTHGVEYLQLSMMWTLSGTKGSVEIWAKSPFASRGGIKLGEAELNGKASAEPCEVVANIEALSSISGKHGLYLIIKAEREDVSVGDLQSLAVRIGE